MSVFSARYCPACHSRAKFLWSLDNVVRATIDTVAGLFVLFSIRVVSLSYQCPVCAMCFEEGNDAKTRDRLMPHLGSAKDRKTR